MSVLSSTRASSSSGSFQRSTATQRVDCWRQTHQYLSPDLLFPEVGNAIWKKVRRGELTADEGQRLAADISSIAVETVPTRGLMIDAHAVAITTGLTVYDAMYLALAVRLKTELITADDRLGRIVAGHPMTARHVRLVQTFE